MREEAWARFTQHARVVLARPTFDEGYRNWKWEVAARVRGLIEISDDPDAWVAALEELVPPHQDFRDHRYDLPRPRQVNWMKRWARIDPTSLREALAAFSEQDGEPVERFAAFAALTERAPETAKVPPSGSIVMGSLFNFALEPERLPMIRPMPFSRVEQALGLVPKQDAPAADLYRHHLEFALRVAERMKGEDLPVRDMVDVQSVILIAGYEDDYWARDEPEEIPVKRARPAIGREDMPYLSICAIYRDEARDLREWIEFHRLVGVERFFLYDNRSTDNHLEVLAPYIENGIVVQRDWPLFPGQFEAYNHCLTEHRHDSRWIALQDVDEFLFSPTGAPVSEVLVDYEHHPAVGVSQVVFGASGHRTRPLGLVVETHTRRDPRPWPFIKNIVDPTHVVRCVNAHICDYDYRTAVDENHEPITYKLGRVQIPSLERLRINHYYFKSEEEGRAKLARPMAIGGSRPYDFDTLERELNAESDETILRFAPALREALEST